MPHLRRPVMLSIATAAALAVGALGTATVANATYPDATLELPRSTSPYPGIGPARPYVQEILIGGVVPLKDGAIMNRTRQGYLLRAGQQDSNVTMTFDNGRLVVVDTGTAYWKFLPGACQRLDVPKGVGASCAMRDRFTYERPMLVEVWPRLGDDTVDSSALPALFELAVLGDRGNDTAYLGAGNDFFNGAQDKDRVYGGAGRDWLRTGLDDDVIDGEADGDHLVGVDGDDTISGGSGDDRLYGIDGNDELHPGEGNDWLNCGDGVDIASAKSADRALGCERVSRR